MAHNKSSTALLHEIDFTFSPIYLSEATYVISSFNLITVLNELIADAIIILQNYRSPWTKAIYVAFSNNTDYPNRSSFDGIHVHPNSCFYKGNLKEN